MRYIVVGTRISRQALLVTAALIGLFGVCAILTKRAVEERRLLLCQSRLRELAPALQAGDQLISVAKWMQIATNADAASCPSCGARYVYSPFLGPVRSIEFDRNAPEGGCLRMVAWCPCDGHRGRRCVLLEGHTVAVLSESAFQTAIAAGHLVSRKLVYPWEASSRTIPTTATGPAWF